MASRSEVAESSGNGNRRVADPQRPGAKWPREPEASGNRCRVAHFWAGAGLVP